MKLALVILAGWTLLALPSSTLATAATGAVTGPLS